MITWMDHYWFQWSQVLRATERLNAQLGLPPGASHFPTASVEARFSRSPADWQRDLPVLVDVRLAPQKGRVARCRARIVKCFQNLLCLYQP